MVKELQYTSIRRVMDDLMEHPLLRDLTLEQVVRYVIRFIGLHGFTKFYQDKIEDVEIDEFRGVLPCDLVSIIQVKDLGTGVCLRAMTDNFTPGLIPHEKKHNAPRSSVYIPPSHTFYREPTFKTQGRVIFTSFPKGTVGVAYKAIPVDDDGYPQLIDNENYLAALEAYIKKQVFTIKFDTGKITNAVLQNTQQEYAWLAKQLSSEFVIPSISEMEAITRSLNTLIPQIRHFDNGFTDLGNREYLVAHNGGNMVGNKHVPKDAGSKHLYSDVEGPDLPPLEAITKVDVDEVTNLPTE